jgi:peroxiredoxin
MRSLVLCTLVSALCLPGCATSTASKPSGGDDASGGARAPDFSLRQVDGRTFRLSDHLGRDVIMLSFWATWCAPCLTEMPALEKLHQTYKDQGFTLVGVSMDGPETVANIRATLRRYGVTYPVVLDEETNVVARYNPTRDAPFAVLIDREGRVAQTKLGYAPGDEVKLEQSIRTLLGVSAASAQ